ncbi:hypothetical protein NPX13_g7336 [Xylaria arbuscula]|uniref:Enoyl reductase (ER) domain-containing protein n=1 Tax=Xylaria arbuscula TaxID=114810 RepID=A0A9W8TKJ1_9PEZI|nr:hypothetical protein NPX13_g7336 [Xylaria arbuscula]
MQPRNRAAYFASYHLIPLDVREAPYTPPGPGEVVIRNHAYPFVLGNDVSGTVVEVGQVDDTTHISHLKPGDRVVGLAVGTTKELNKSSHSTFQCYTVLRSTLVAKIPDSLSFEGACVLPLDLSTAAYGLFLKDFLALRYPVARESTNADSRSAIVIWGGSTSIGSHAIQLAAAAGYELFTTASPKNFEYVKALGASHVWDCQDPRTVKSMIKALQNKDYAGALAAGNGSLEACIKVVASVPGRRFVSQATIPIGPSKTTLDVITTVTGYIWWSLSVTIKAKFKGVTTKLICDFDPTNSEVGPIIFNEFLPKALANGTFVAKPDPQVVGKGLAHIQTGLNAYKDALKQGVSMEKKLVVSL